MGRKRVRGVVQILVSVLLLGLVLRQVRWAEAWALLRQMDLRWLGVAWGLFLCGLVVRAVRWQILLGALGVHRPLRELVSWYFVGGFFNVILPTGFGGDAVRVVELGQDTSRLGTVLNSVIVERYLGLMVLLAMGLLAALVRPAVAPPATVIMMAALLVGGLCMAWLLRAGWRPRQQGPGSRLARWLRWPELVLAVAPYTRGVLARAAGASLAFNLLQIAWNVTLGLGVGLHLPVTTYLLCVPLTAVALLLPAFGGLGVRELSYVGLFSSVGVAPARALALSLGVYLITVASGLVGGVIYLVGGIRRTS